MSNNQGMPGNFEALASDPLLANIKATAQKNGINVHIVANAATARVLALSLIPDGSAVFTGSSLTLEETGIAQEVNQSPRVVSLRKKLAELDRTTQSDEMRRLLATPDIVLGSVHAITEDGALLVASNTGSQLAHYAFAARRVILVCGAQKVVGDELEGQRRIREFCLPLENERALRSYGVPSSVAKTLTINKDVPGRIDLIIVQERLGH